MLENPTLQKECIEFVTVKGVLIFLALGLTPAPFSSLFSLYCALKHELTIKDWIQEFQPFDLNIDVRRFILFGVLKGYIYRIHKFPLASKTSWRKPISSPSTLALVSQNPTGNLQLEMSDASRIRSYFDGRHSADEICTICKISQKELDDIIAKENVLVIYK